MSQPRICYHGTTKANADCIAKDGFRAGTYFAYHLEDATGFGGEYIFEVAFPEGAEARDGWQFTWPRVVPPSRIVAHYRLRKTPISENDELRKTVFNAGRAWKLGGGE